ncbi:hypothetical protein GE061_017526 [Apolygus lucorum]|uniref:SAP domain-containing protein n=1 Tax=Apolygus lucorum TaxID=248454 RepID=A0A8S9XDX3_APOLU|nr:hypothetical protein GE061_017526 [Apolygus lucorum]
MNPSTMRVAQLKEELKNRSLKTTGKKSDLIKRLEAAIEVENSKDEGDDEEIGEDEEAIDTDDDVDESDSSEGGSSNVSSRRGAKRGQKYKQMQLRGGGVSFKDVEGMVRPFSGQDNCLVQKWVAEYEGVALLLELNDLQKLVFAQRLLTGLAKVFVQTENYTTWKTLKAGLIDEFKTVSTSRELHLELSKRTKKREESTQEYLIRMREIASKGSIDDESLIQYVINGLPDSTANKAILYGAISITEFKNKLKLYDKMKKSVAPNTAQNSKDSVVPAEKRSTPKPVTKPEGGKGLDTLTKYNR